MKKDIDKVINILWNTATLVAYDSLSNRIITGNPDKLAMIMFRDIICYGKSYIILLGDL